ncbi:MAG: NADH-quinone oxidoreductase subunit NuoE [Candidatus Aminicenantes bacterium]|nr:NADH-quinone oxidoreductase subunit NuoE [Candidatus Aminicenantes bacterium]
MSPEFSEQTKKKIKEVISRYPRMEASLLPVLHLTQQEFGYLPEEAERAVAKMLRIKPVRVREAVTFYTMLHSQKKGKYHIQVCSNLTCSILGAEKLIDYLRNKLKIEPGETTADSKFTLSTVECLGACEAAPCMQINFDYYGNLDKKRIDSILESLD